MPLPGFDFHIQRPSPRNTPRFPIRVNCWFCNKDTEVSFQNRNSWICPHCEQYNGFLEDGGYNKIIPAQIDELLNHPVISAKRFPFKSNENGLCRKCNINQELKIQQLASFTPIDSAHYDEEILLYGQRLERAYQLCPECDSKTQHILKKIDKWIQEKYVILKTATSRDRIILWPKQLFRPVVTCCDVLLASISVILFTCVFARMLPLTTLQASVATRNVLASSLDWEQCLITAAGILHLVSATTRRHSIAMDLLPAAVWTLVVMVNCESSRLKEGYNLQYIAYTQVIIMSVTQGATIWSRLQLPSKPRKKIKRKNVAEELKGYTVLNEKSENVESVIDCMQSTDISTLESADSPNNNKTFADNSILKCKSDPQAIQSSLGSLSLGPSNSSLKSSSSLFEPRIYQPTNYAVSEIYKRSDLNDTNSLSDRKYRKPVISPARLNLNQFTHSSWVAGGYWQQNHVFPSSIQTAASYSNQNIYPFPNTSVSRSSSQSSGFVSRGGTNVSSLPNSRTGSVCDVDRCSVLSEPIYPTYSPPMYYYLTSSPPPGATLVFPTHSTQPLPSPEYPASRSSLNYSTDSVVGCATTDTGHRPLVSIVKENLLLACLFFSSLMFNIIVIALAAVNTFRAH